MGWLCGTGVFLFISIKLMAFYTGISGASRLPGVSSWRWCKYKYYQRNSLLHIGSTPTSTFFLLLRVNSPVPSFSLKKSKFCSPFPLIGVVSLHYDERYNAQESRRCCTAHANIRRGPYAQRSICGLPVVHGWGAWDHLDFFEEHLRCEWSPG